MSRVFVGGFPRDLEEEELKEIFQAFGQVEAVKIVRDKRTGISRRFGFVDLDSKESADLAIQNLHEGSIDEDIISVKHAVVEEPKPKPAVQPQRERAQKVQWKPKQQGGYNKGKQNNGYGGKSNYGSNNRSNSGYGNQNNRSYGNQNSGYGNQNRSYGNQNSSYNNQNSGNSYDNQNSGYGNQNAGYGNQGSGYNNGYRSSRPQNDSGSGKPKRPRINRNG